jgi:uncharacterized protein (PEP-CTERM system associated)
MICMSPTNNTKNSSNYRALLFLAIYSTATAILSLPSDSDAGEFVFTPHMRTDLIFTDNVGLRPKGSPDKEADFVSRLVPGVYAKYTSRRFDSETDYRLINTIYQNRSDRNRSMHNLTSINTAEIVKDFFFFDGNVRMRQQNANLAGRQGDDVNLTGNLRNIRQYSASPYIRRRFGDVASTELRYARIMTDSDSSRTFFNSQANSYTGSILSGPSFQALQWGLNYTRQDIDFDLRPDSVRLESGLANVRYNINRVFGITGTGGYENNTFGGGARDKPKGARWSAGFIWTPTPRTSIEGSAGQRFFGDTYFGNASHRTRLFAFNAFYKEDINSAYNILNIDSTGNTINVLTDLFTAQAPPGTDPAEIGQIVQLIIGELGLPPTLAYASGFLTNRFFLQKSFESSVALNTAKNTGLVRVFHTTRRPIDNRPLLDALLQGGATAYANTKQEGVSALWSFRFSPRTRFNANFLYNRIYFYSLNRTDKIKLFECSISRELTPNVIGLLRYRRNDRRSTNRINEYVENRFTASVSVRF